MNSLEFTKYLVSKIVSKPDLVSVKEFDTEEGKNFEVLVCEEDMGKVIGKQGKIALAIRTIVNAKAYNDGIKGVKINFSSF